MTNSRNIHKNETIMEKHELPLVYPTAKMATIISATLSSPRTSMSPQRSIDSVVFDDDEVNSLVPSMQTYDARVTDKTHIKVHAEKPHRRAETDIKDENKEEGSRSENFATDTNNIAFSTTPVPMHHHSSSGFFQSLPKVLQEAVGSSSSDASNISDSDSMASKPAPGSAHDQNPLTRPPLPCLWLSVLGITSSDPFATDRSRGPRYERIREPLSPRSLEPVEKWRVRPSVGSEQVGCKWRNERG
jgi:hypothetical protein